MLPDTPQAAAAPILSATGLTRLYGPPGTDLTRFIDPDLPGRC